MTHFDVIIVGSGFGGSVTAYRLAEAGKRVCVLERGKAYPPGSFPRSPERMRKNFWDPSNGLHGMYNVWSFRHLSALVSSGLGGGSLIYANVLIRKDEKWFVNEDLQNGGYEDWPITRKDLELHYDRAEKMLGAQRYPFLEAEPYKSTAKTSALKFAAEELKKSGRYQPGEVKWYLPNLAVTFANAGQPPRQGEPIHEPEPNLHGRSRSTCTGCGECNVGCNSGSKNSLDYTYLSAAKRWDADIRTRTEVKSFKPRGPDRAGYEVSFVTHKDDENSSALLPLTTFTCDRLVISAGAVGSPFLLLKNQANFPGLSDKLGTRVSGNGDLLGVALNCQQRVDGEPVARPIEPASGPVITSTIRVGDAVDGDGARGRGFYLQDAGFPAFVEWMMLGADAPGTIARGARFVESWIGRHLGSHRDSNLSSVFASILGDGGISASSMPLLGMGRDFPTGRMSLKNGYLDLDWALAGSSEYFTRVREVMKDVSAALGAEFVDDPIWYLSRSITVHPLGGCPMGRTAEEGVVDANGEVFGHPGLYVLDGSIMPGPVGPNPSLTIAALADRAADRMLNL